MHVEWLNGCFVVYVIKVRGYYQDAQAAHQSCENDTGCTEGHDEMLLMQAPLSN